MFFQRKMGGRLLTNLYFKMAKKKKQRKAKKLKGIGKDIEKGVMDVDKKMAKIIADAEKKAGIK